MWLSFEPSKIKIYLFILNVDPNTVNYNIFSDIINQPPMRNKLRILFIFGLFACACSPGNKFEAEDGLQSLTVKGLEEHVRVLASDEYQGRKPFTEGETKTLAYLQDQFKAIGLEPGNGDSYLQEVPMVEITTKADSVMQVTSAKGKLELKGFTDYTLNTERADSSIVWKNEELVFAGFGIVAPEYNWNDYEGLDVKNKIVIVLVNDPGFRW